MIYSDGLNIIFMFGGIYAAGTFGFKFQEIIIFGIAINLAAGAGSASFAWFDEKFGPKITILVCLFFLVFFGSLLVLVQNYTLFWVLGILLGVFVGPTQSASRSLMARIAPKSMISEMFGLYAMSGKATAFLGPSLFAFFTSFFNSQRAGMASAIVLLVIGFFLLIQVNEPKY